MKPNQIKVGRFYIDKTYNNVRKVLSVFKAPGKEGVETLHVSYEVIIGRKPQFFRKEHPIMTLKSFSEWALKEISEQEVYDMQIDLQNPARTKNTFINKPVIVRMDKVYDVLLDAVKKLDKLNYNPPEEIKKDQLAMIRWLGNTALKVADDYVKHNQPEMKEPFRQDSAVYWKSSDGKKYMPRDMTDAHLLNTFRFILRQCLNADGMDDGKGNSYTIDPDETEYDVVLKCGDIERKIANECLKRKLIDPKKKAIY
ncbi:MAG: hypothetical protein HPY53_01410 [Brevinematales bacterium]|nr:hypothetical protein [Brevinematales bacterium]